MNAEPPISARSRAELGLSDLVPDALAVLAAVLRETKAQRNVGAKVAAARYVLDTVLQLAAATVRPPSDASAGGQARISPEAAVAELRRRLSRSGTGGQSQGDVPAP